MRSTHLAPERRDAHVRDDGGAPGEHAPHGDELVDVARVQVTNGLHLGQVEGLGGEDDIGRVDGGGAARGQFRDQGPRLLVHERDNLGWVLDQLGVQGGVEGEDVGGVHIEDGLGVLVHLLFFDEEKMDG